jgi:hypothetical protein
MNEEKCEENEYILKNRKKENYYAKKKINQQMRILLGYASMQTLTMVILNKWMHRN